MSDQERIPCPGCAVMILPLTAKYNHGHCPRCSSDIERREREKIEAFYRKNPPKSQAEIDEIAPLGDLDKLLLRMFLGGLLAPKISADEFSELRLVSELRKSISKDGHSPATVADDFHSLTDDVIASGRSHFHGLKKIPRPFRELRAVLELWGTVQSDGLWNYLEGYDPKMDDEVASGLKLLGLDSCVEAIWKARERYMAEERRIWKMTKKALQSFLKSARSADGQKLEKEFEEHEDVLYRELDDFAGRLLGPFLIRHIVTG